MKNSPIKSILIIFFSVLSYHSFSQSFEKGDWNIDLGFNLGIYKTTSSYTVTLPFLGTRTVIEDDGAASKIVPLTVEYGLSNKFSLGIQLGFANYFIDKEDSTNNTDRVNSVDFALLVNYHLLTTEKNDLMIGIGLGGSSVDWVNIDDTELKGTGSYFNLQVKDRLFFGEHIRMFFNLGFTTYRYTNIKNVSNNNTIEGFTWKLSGVNFGTGLAVKF